LGRSGVDPLRTAPLACGMMWLGALAHSNPLLSLLQGVSPHQCFCFCRDRFEYIRILPALCVCLCVVCVTKTLQSVLCGWCGVREGGGAGASVLVAVCTLTHS